MELETWCGSRVVTPLGAVASHRGMSREYVRMHEYCYLPLHELQPPAPYNLYDLHSASTSTAPAYEMTSGGGMLGNAHAQHALQQPHLQPTHANQHDPRKRNNSQTQFNGVSENYMASCDVQMPGPSASPMQVAGPRKRKSPPYTNGSESFMAACDAPLPGPSAPRIHVVPTRKRKSSSYGTASAFDDDGGDETRSMRTLPDKKRGARVPKGTLPTGRRGPRVRKRQNHSEIEKRRRDKMNTYITELSLLIPLCGAMTRKLDKLTVLRMAVQYIRTIRGALSACPLSARPRPSFLTEREVNSLILQAAHDCFLLVVGCDRGRLLFVSKSVKRMLQYDQSELPGQSLFDILHPKDVAKVKEQLSSSDLSPRERLIDAKTMLPLKADVVTGASRLCPGARRSFFCRIKCKAGPEAQATQQVPIKEEGEPAAKMRKKQSEKKYCVVQCTGYLKSWAPVDMSESPGSSPEGAEDGDACNLSCLVAVVRALPDLAPAPAPVPTPVPAPAPPTRQLQFVSRLAPDGKFTFVDQRVTLALGFLPQELLGTSLYEYVSGPELGSVAKTHKMALQQRTLLVTPPYLFRKKDGSLVRIQTQFKPFKNPWTKEVECLVANNTIVSESQMPTNTENAESTYDMYKQNADVEMQRLIESQVESHKIGCAIAEEALRRASPEFAAELPADLLQDVIFNQQWPLKANVLYEQAALVDNILAGDPYVSVRNNVPLSAAGGENSPPPTAPEQLPGTPPPPSPPLPPLSIDGNSEAAMAVIMSLLEADAGLGGPVNFSGLPWPLP